MQRALVISCDETESNTVFYSKELGKHIDYNITYRKVNNVQIEIDGKQIALESAIQNSHASFAPILYYAQRDAENGFCEEQYTSKLGLAHFTYRYPEFDLRIVNDIYETPDGNQHFIKDLAIFKSGQAVNAYTDFYDADTGERLDLENWGISFDAVRISPVGITLNCKQSGGQQIGSLILNHYIVSNDKGFCENLQNNGEAIGINLPIQMNATSELILDWSSFYGELPAGKYSVLLYVSDEFESSQVHPLMKDFHNLQRYTLEFEIPS